MKIQITKAYDIGDGCIECSSMWIPTIVGKHPNCKAFKTVLVVKEGRMQRLQECIDAEVKEYKFKEGDRAIVNSPGHTPGCDRGEVVTRWADEFNINYVVHVDAGWDMCFIESDLDEDPK